MTTAKLLLQKYSGPLRVKITTRDGDTHDFEPDLEQATLFDYVCHACACIFTNLTTRLTIRTAPDHWQVTRFSPNERVLEVVQVGGEELRIEEDGPVRLRAISGWE